MNLVIMGVSGSGKSSVGAALSARLALPYVDGDDLHPATNIAKMSAGIPLTDDDRWPWLTAVGQALARRDGHGTGRGMIIGCSALKRAYRDHIRAAAGAPVTFIHLAGDKALIAGRMAARQGHFMPTTLLDSQYAALEPPQPDETAVTVSIDQPLDAIVSAIVTALAEADGHDA